MQYNPTQLLSTRRHISLLREILTERTQWRMIMLPSLLIYFHNAVDFISLIMIIVCGDDEDKKT